VVSQGLTQRAALQVVRGVAQVDGLRTRYGFDDDGGQLGRQRADLLEARLGPVAERHDLIHGGAGDAGRIGHASRLVRLALG
jgi:hypothetical protein